MNENTIHDCPACGAPNDTPLGVLGDRLWFRCRDCGMEFSVRIKKEGAK